MATALVQASAGKVGQIDVVVILHGEPEELGSEQWRLRRDLGDQDTGEVGRGHAGFDLREATSIDQGHQGLHMAP